MHRHNSSTSKMMYLESKIEKMQLYPIIEENSLWKTITITGVMVKAGKEEIGFVTEGAANSFCYVDDVTFVKRK